MKKNQKKAKPFGIALLKEIPASELVGINGGTGSSRKGKFVTMAISMPSAGHHRPDHF